MRKRVKVLVLGLVLVCLGAVIAYAQEKSDASTNSTTSVADLARQVKAQKAKEAKPVKVFTNDTLPEPKPGENISSSGPADNSASTESKAGAPPALSPEDKAKEDKLTAARDALDKAKAAEQQSEDELNLLQLQQGRENNPTALMDLNAKVQAKQAEVNANKAKTDAAQKAVDDLENESKESAPSTP